MDHKGDSSIDTSNLESRLGSLANILIEAKKNNTYTTTVEVKSKGVKKTSDELESVGESARTAAKQINEAVGAYDELLKKIQNSRGMNTDKFNKFANSLEQIKALINDVTSGMDRVSATGKGKTQIDYDINNIKKLAKPTIKQQQEWSKRVVSVVGNNQDISPDNLNVIKNTAMEMARLIEYFDRQSKLLKGIDIKHDTDFDIRAYADDSKELYRLQRMIMERNNTIKSITGTDILDGKELQKYIMGIIKADGSIINEKEFLSNLKKYIEDKLLRFDYKTLEDGTYNAKEVNARQRNFDRIIESRKSLITTQKRINERRTPGAIPESELAKPERQKKTRKQFQKYYGMSTSKALKGVMDAYREAESGELKDNKQLLAYFKAFKESGGNEKDIPKDIIEMITSLMKDQKTYGKYLQKLDAEFSEYRNTLPKEEPRTETPGPTLPPAKEEIKETGAAAQKMGEQIKDGAKKGAAALDDLKGKAEETGKAIKEANDKATETENIPIKIEGKSGSESTPMTRDQLKKRLEKDQEKEQKEPEPERVPQSEENTKTLAEKLKLLQDIKKEYKFLEGAEDKRIDMEEKAWDVGGNNPKSEAESNKKITAYEDHMAHMDRAQEAVDDFESTYEKLIITLKDGQKIEITDFIDLEDLSLAKKNISDIQLILAKNESSNEPTVQEKNKYTFAADIKQLKGYGDANTDFITNLIVEVVSGTKRYDKAMEELKAHISQRQEEIRQEQEKNLRINTEIGKFGQGANPILEAMGLTDESPRPKAYTDMIAEIQSESMKGEEAVTKFAEAVGYTYDEVNKKWAKINESESLTPNGETLPSSDSNERQKTLDFISNYQSALDNLSSQAIRLMNIIQVAKDRWGELGQETKDALIQLNLFNSNGEFLGKFNEQGMSAFGAAMNGQHAIIARRSNTYDQRNDELYNYGTNNYLDLLIQKEQEAYDQGINLARILSVIKTHDNGLIYEIQEQAPGAQIHNISKYDTLEQFLVECGNLSEATDAQIQKLLDDAIALSNLGFKLDFGVGNILYDKNTGFHFIDLELRELDEQIPKTESLILRLYRSLLGGEIWEDWTSDKKKGFISEDNLNRLNAMIKVGEKLQAVWGKGDNSFLQKAIEARDKVSNGLKKQAADQRASDITQRITGNADFSQYGDQSWLQAYIDRARNETTELDQIYADFEKQLSERKAAILLQQQKDDALAENQDKFKSFIRGISPTGEDEYNLNMDKYRDVFNAITDEANTLDDAINKVKADLAQMEVDKFNSAKDGILSQYGKTEKDIPSDQWQAFLDGLANGSLTAADALKQLQDALEKMKNTTPPPQNNPPGGGNNNPPGGNIPPSGGQPGGGSGNNPPPNPPSPTPTPKKPPKKHKIISRSRKDDDSWEDRYSDELGNVWAEGERFNKKTKELEYYSQNITNYIKLENEAIRVTEKLIDTQNALNKAKTEGQDKSVTDALRDRIRLLGQERKEVDQQAAEYARRQTDPRSPYTMELYNERVGRKTKEYKTNADVKNAQMLVDLAEKEAAAKAKTDSILQKQRDKVDAITRKEIDTREDIPDSTFDSLIDEYTSIVDMINSNKGQTSLSQAFQTQLDSAVKHFETSVAVMKKEAQIALKLSGKNPDEAKAVITKDMNALMEDMMRSTAKGVTGQGGLQEQLQALMDSFAKSTDNSSGYIKSVNQQVNVLRSNFQQAENSMNFAKSVEKDVADYEKAVEQVGKIQAQMDFGDGKNKNQLALQLEDAKKAADDCFTQVERVQTAINQVGTGTDKWRQDINDRIDRANNKHTDEKNTASYLDAKAANDKRSLADAQAALTKYESALEKVAKAKANLDFGDASKQSALTAELTKAQEEANKLKAELDGVADVLKNSPLLSEQEKTANENRLKADQDIYNDPTKSPYYQSAQNVSGDKAKAEAVREIAKAYKEWYAAINDVLKAAGNDEMLAEKRAIEAAKLRELMNTVDDAKTHGAISSDKDYQDEIDPLREAGQDVSYATFDSYKQKLYASYNELIKQLGDTVNPQLKSQVDQIKQSLDQLFELDQNGEYANIKSRTDINDVVDDINLLSNTLSKTNIKDIVAKNKISNFADTLGVEDLKGMSSEYVKAFTQIEAEYNNLLNTLQQKAVSGNITSDDFQQATKAVDEYIKRLKDLQKTREANEISGKKGAYVEGLFGKLDAKDLGTSKQAIKDWVEANGGQIKGGMDAINASVGGKTFKFERINDLDNSIQSVVLKLNSATGAVYEFVGEANKISLVSNVFKGLAGGLAQYATMMLSTHRVMSQFTSQFKQGFSMLTEYDKALTTISYTMDVSKEQLGQMGQAAVDMANDLKMSLSDTLDIYQIYANMNTSPEEIRETAMPTAILANLSGVDASTAADQIQGVIQQFRLLEDAETSAADVSMHIADVFDKISANISMDYARGIKTMADAVQKTGAEAMNAGLSFEQLSAITAKVAERTRAEGSEIGGAIRTILVRLSKVGKMPGYEDEVSNEELSNASKSLHAIGVEVYDAQGNFREFDTIIEELAEKWDSLSDAQRSNISYNIAA